MCYNFKTDIENKVCNYTGSTERDKIEFHNENVGSMQEYQCENMAKYAGIPIWKCEKAKVIIKTPPWVL